MSHPLFAQRRTLVPIRGIDDGLNNFSFVQRSHLERLIMFNKQTTNRGPLGFNRALQNLFSDISDFELAQLCVFW